MRLRGNHDCRGFYAEKIGDYIPLDGENTFFKFHLGPICGVALDCGEDKEDSCAAYGHTVCCHPYREAQTDFLNRTAEFAQNDDAWKRADYRLVICHVPFTRIDEKPFDIENEIYEEWVRILREKIHPDCMLCGHTHTVEVNLPGSEFDHRGQTWPVVIGAKPCYMDDENDPTYIGAAFTLKNGGIQVAFTDSNKKVLETYVLKEENEKEDR